MSFTRIGLLALLSLHLLACVAPGQHSTANISVERQKLLAGPPELATPEPDVEILAVDDDMRQYLAEAVPDDAHSQRKAKLLLRAFFADDGIQVQYDNIETGTAIETFHSRKGNCLAFTNLFVAMARELGLRAYFQEVETPPMWDSRGGFFVYSRHINVLLKHKHADDQVVDFDMTNFNEEFPRRKISDAAAAAQYHNNMSVHWLLREDAGKALAHQRLALKMQPDADYMWTNLGVVYSHFGYSDYAESAFLTALIYDKDDLVALSNLARLYRRRGNEELAEFYAGQAQSFRLSNPYYLYSLAAQHYEEGEYLQARQELKRAIRLQKGEHVFHQLLGLTALQMGDSKFARENFEKAAELALVPTDKARYNRKLELLAGINAR